MSEKIKLKSEFIEKFREKGRNEGKEAEPKEETKEAKFNEEIKREINQHLKYLWEKIENESAYQSGRAVSRDEIKKIQKKQESNEALIQKAKKQLGVEKPGKELLHIILDFPTSEEKEADDKLHMISKLLKRQGDKLNESTKKQILSLENQKEAERNKRNNWAKQLIENWEKRG